MPNGAARGYILPHLYDDLHPFWQAELDRWMPYINAPQPPWWRVIKRSHWNFDRAFAARMIFLTCQKAPVGGKL
jgi:hypothetical protein